MRLNSFRRLVWTALVFLFSPLSVFAGLISGNGLVGPTDSGGNELAPGQLIVFVLDEGGDGMFAGNTDGGLFAGQSLQIGSFLGGNDRVLGFGQTKAGLLGDVVGNLDGITFTDSALTSHEFGVYFFDHLAAGSTEITDATMYGFARAGDWILPEDKSHVFGGDVGTFSVVNGGSTLFSVSPVPEPSAALLFGLALASLLRRQRSRSIIQVGAHEA